MFKIGVILMAFSATLLGNWFTDLFDRTPTPPLHLPIDLSRAGSVVETEVRVKEDGWYDFELDILYDKEKVVNGIKDAHIASQIIGYNRYDPRTGKQLRTVDYEYLYKKLKKQGILIDKSYTGDGVIMPIKLTINQILDDKSKKTIINKIYESKGYGNANSYRAITEIELKKGKYGMKLENIKSIKEMQGRKANIRFGRAYHGK